MELYTASVADSDGLLRVYEEDIPNFNVRTLDRFLSRMAEVSLFFRTLEDLKEDMSIGERIRNVARGIRPEKWHPCCFPLSIMNTLKAYLYDSDSYRVRFLGKDGLGTSVKEKYGFDWMNIKNGFSTQDLRNEQERLRVVAAVL